MFPEQIRASAAGKDLPLPRVISNILFTFGLDNISRRNENKMKPATSEGVIDRKLSLSVAQWTQFIEHDLSRTVSRSMGETMLQYLFEKDLVYFLSSERSSDRMLRPWICANTAEISPPLLSTTADSQRWSSLSSTPCHLLELREISVGDWRSAQTRQHQPGELSMKAFRYTPFQDNSSDHQFVLISFIDS